MGTFQPPPLKDRASYANKKRVKDSQGHVQTQAQVILFGWVVQPPTRSYTIHQQYFSFAMSRRITGRCLLAVLAAAWASWTFVRWPVGAPSRDRHLTLKAAVRNMPKLEIEDIERNGGGN